MYLAPRPCLFLHLLNLESAISNYRSTTGVSPIFLHLSNLEFDISNCHPKAQWPSHHSALPLRTATHFQPLSPLDLRSQAA
jgi:hypothetical protein